jgi:phospholipid/cholesterol/gamma-HCH transport system ATP-binding protein
MSEPVIQVDALTIGWGDLVLMQDLTFDVEAGDVFAILGGSGSGKSTLLRNMIGSRRRRRGRCTIRGARRATGRAVRRSACSSSRARSSAR